MIDSSTFPFTAGSLPFYFIRAFIHTFVLFGLLVHQFLSQPFVDPHLSVSVYSLCFLILFLDSFSLFFYKDNQENLPFYLLFADALFLSALLGVMGHPGLFLVFILAFVQSCSFSLFGRMFQTLVFLIGLSAMLPLVLVWAEGNPPEDRLSLSFLIYFSLFFIFCCAYFLNLFKDQKEVMADRSLEHLPPSQTLTPMDISLAKKIKPILDSLTASIGEKTKGEDTEYSVTDSFLPEKGKQQLQQLRGFVLDFIDYVEPKTRLVLEDKVDVKKLLENLLKKLESHPQRPENLIQNIKWPEEFKIRGSVVHLKKCFEHILINAFEALKNQGQPKINIQGYLEKSWVVLEISDNGHGIETEDKDKIFTPFFSKRFGLRGLGLPYVQKIIKAHKAELNVESFPQQGTGITIRFPLDSGFYDSSLKLTKKKYKKTA